MTPAIRALEAAEVAYTVHPYDHDGAAVEVAGGYGREAAAALGVPEAEVFKTLVVELDASGGRSALAVAIVPSCRQLSFKAVAAALDAKRATMCDVARAERATGYVAGGISPFGQKKRLQTVLDATAASHEVIYVSGGRRGLDLAVAPADLVSQLGASVAAISV